MSSREAKARGNSSSSFGHMRTVSGKVSRSSSKKKKKKARDSLTSDQERSQLSRYNSTVASPSPQNLTVDTNHSDPPCSQNESGKMSRAIRSLLQRVEQIKTDIDRMQKRLRKNSKLYSNTRARIGGVEERAKTLRAQLEEQSDLCQAEYATVSQHLLQLQSIGDVDIADLKDKVTTMQMQWDDQQQQLSAIRRQLANNAGTIVSLPQRAVHDVTSLISSTGRLVWRLLVRAYNFIVSRTSAAAGDDVQ